MRHSRDSSLPPVRIDGDTFVVNGQKIWTSGGHVAKWMILLARTDPTAPKHRGISFVLDARVVWKPGHCLTVGQHTSRPR